MAASTRIPPFYHALFIWVDGLYSLLVAFIHFFAYEGPTRQHFPQFSEIMPMEAFRPFFFPIGGGMLFVATIQFALLRHSDELRTWKVVQMAHTMLDVSMLLSLREILVHLPPATWRETIASGAFQGLFLVGGRTVVRLLFLADVGLKKDVKSAKRL